MSALQPRTDVKLPFWKFRSGTSQRKKKKAVKNRNRTKNKGTWVALIQRGKKGPKSEIVSLLKAVVSKEEGKKNNEKQKNLFSLLRSVPVSATSEVSCRRASKECGSRAEAWTSPSPTVDPKVCPGMSASHSQSSLAGRR